MKTRVQESSKVKPVGRQGFTLVEMLAVIAIIALLASLVVGLTSRAKRARTESQLKVTRDQLVTAIESYYAHFGSFPPDNSLGYPQAQINSVSNALYYELTGTIVDNQTGEFFTPDRGEAIRASDILQYFGVEGFVNAVPSTGDMAADARKVRQFIELKPNQHGALSTQPGVEVLVVPVQWPLNEPPGTHPVPSRLGLNPWRYVSTNPTNNPGRFDLWAEFVDGKRVRIICNWSSEILDKQ
jgi:prepilin-type N-terminal cleavage/methylation domain-containing protein